MSADSRVTCACQKRSADPSSCGCEVTEHVSGKPAGETVGPCSCHAADGEVSVERAGQSSRYTQGVRAFESLVQQEPIGDRYEVSRSLPSETESDILLRSSMLWEAAQAAGFESIPAFLYSRRDDPDFLNRARWTAKIEIGLLNVLDKNGVRLQKFSTADVVRTLGRRRVVNAALGPRDELGRSISFRPLSERSSESDEDEATRWSLIDWRDRDERVVEIPPRESIGLPEAQLSLSSELVEFGQALEGTRRRSPPSNQIQRLQPMQPGTPRACAPRAEGASGGLFGPCGVVGEPPPGQADYGAAVGTGSLELPVWMQPDNPCYGLDPLQIVTAADPPDDSSTGGSKPEGTGLLNEFRAAMDAVEKQYALMVAFAAAYKVEFIKKAQLIKDFPFLVHAEVPNSTDTADPGWQFWNWWVGYESEIEKHAIKVNVQEQYLQKYAPDVPPQYMKPDAAWTHRETIRELHDGEFPGGAYIIRDWENGKKRANGLYQQMQFLKGIMADWAGVFSSGANSGRADLLGECRKWLDGSILQCISKGVARDGSDCQGRLSDCGPEVLECPNQCTCPDHDSMTANIAPGSAQLAPMADCGNACCSLVAGFHGPGCDDVDCSSCWAGTSHDAGSVCTKRLSSDIFHALGCGFTDPSPVWQLFPVQTSPVALRPFEALALQGTVAS